MFSRCATFSVYRGCKSLLLSATSIVKPSSIAVRLINDYSTRSDCQPLIYRDPTKPLFDYTEKAVIGSVFRVSTTEDGKKLKLICKEDGEMRYHGVWLRHNCRCPECYAHAAHNTTVRPEHLTGDNKILAAELKDDIVHVSFHNHTALYPVDWLKEHAYSNPDILYRKHKEAEPLVAKSLPVSDYNEVVHTKEGQYKWLRQLNFYGVSLIQNGPAELNTLQKTADRIGYIQESVYGELFHVKTIPDPDNLSYSSNDLIFHMDLLYDESPAGIQMLHCLKNDPCVEGGESIILDAYPVIKQLREEYPEYFNTLCTLPVPYMKIDYVDEKKYDMKFARPHITLDKYGEVAAIRWNPPGQYAISVPEDKVEEYYAAFIQLSKMFAESDLKMVHRFEPGEMMTFNNRRMLHARNSFKQNGGLRHLQGLYIKADFLRSKFIVLSNELGKKEHTKRVFIDNMFE